MDVRDYIETIHEELEDAEKYIRKAICCKSAHPEWAFKYAKMSEEELGHAEGNLKIFEQDLDSQPEEIKTIYESIRESVISMYVKHSERTKISFQTYQGK